MSGYGVQPVTASDGFSVSPSDTTVVKADALYIGGSGDVVVVTKKGNTVTFMAVPAGTTLPIQVVHVKAATDASNIVALTY